MKVSRDRLSDFRSEDSIPCRLLEWMAAVLIPLTELEDGARKTRTNLFPFLILSPLLP